MAKHGNRVARSKEDLQLELREQLELLVYACERYDAGKEAIGRHIALSLRVLLNHHGRSRSLLEQLGLRAGRWIDTAGAINPRNLATDSNLLMIRATNEGARYLPLCHMGESPNTGFEEFSVWWTRPVLKDNKGRFMSRMDIVSHIANSDGGAHVDPELDEAYMALSRQNSLGWEFSKDGIIEAIAGRPELACVRQIAHEVLESLKATGVSAGDRIE
ncbi:hypothetical protein [Caballeronia sordidicola]|uniref:hypothetical protein n=1 Tax=Caballeronia sordidicola TaxID=196367 RepID=UPI00094C8AE1|nr:hypothetical protein [Caballeronia sordidicola]